MAITKRLAIGLATATAVIWGLSFLSIKTAVAAIPPVSLGLARFIVASAVLLAVFAVMRRRPTLALKDLPRMAGAGLVGVTLYFLGENNGVLLLSASEASIIVGTIPVLTMIADRVLVRTRLTAAQYAGAGLSAVGVSLIVVESLRLSPAPLGYLYMGLAAVAWVAYAFMTRPLLAKYDSLEVTLWQSLFGAVGFVPFALFERVEWALVTPVVVVNVLYLGVFCSAIGYLFYIASLNALGAGVSSVFINLIPVVSVAASFVILGERLSPVQLAGGAVAVGGVYMASFAGGEGRGGAGRRNGKRPADGA
ncbi:MAG: DMT family transporter [Spirochaetes bacterium]|nr:DMT family transporter [Spirochaetota bacterium]MBU1079225.1 DMT family transporter [Spirochaetota bacterium]